MEKASQCGDLEAKSGQLEVVGRRRDGKGRMQLEKEEYCSHSKNSLCGHSEGRSGAGTAHAIPSNIPPMHSS